MRTRNDWNDGDRGSGDDHMDSGDPRSLLLSATPPGDLGCNDRWFSVIAKRGVRISRTTRLHEVEGDDVGCIHRRGILCARLVSPVPAQSVGHTDGRDVHLPRDIVVAQWARLLRGGVQHAWGDTLLGFAILAGPGLLYQPRDLEGLGPRDHAGGNPLHSAAPVGGPSGR